MRWLYLLGMTGIAGVLISDIWCDIDYRYAANVSLIYMAILATVFVVRYGVWSKWWTNRIGMVYFAMSVIMAFVLLQAVVTVWTSYSYPGREVARFIIYSLGAVAYVPMLVSLWREQKRDRKRRGDD